MRYLLLLIAGALVVATAVLTVEFSPPSVPPYVVHSAAAASDTANALLAAMSLPDGARPLSVRDSNGWQSLDPFDFPDPAAANEMGLWQVPLSVDQLATFIEHHIPSGLSAVGPDGDTQSAIPSSGSFVYASSSHPGPQYYASPFTRVDYEFFSTDAATTSSTLGIGVQVFWTPIRPASEEVPTNTHFVQVTRIGFRPLHKEVVVSRVSVSSTSKALVQHFTAVIGALPVALHGPGPVCLGLNVGPNSVFYRYVVAFASSAAAAPEFVVDYNFCSDVTIVAGGRSEPPLFDEPRKNGLVTSQALNSAIEGLFSPGTPLAYVDG